MTINQDILIVLLIGIIAQATNTDLANNTNILLLLLLALGAYNQTSSCGNCNNSCSGIQNSFI